MTRDELIQYAHPEGVMALAFPVEVGDIVQIKPEKEMFGACMVTVTETKSWGIQGYVQSAGVPGQQYVRLQWEDIAPTGGKAVWVAE